MAAAVVTAATVVAEADMADTTEDRVEAMADIQDIMEAVEATENATVAGGAVAGAGRAEAFLLNMVTEIPFHPLS
jgi:hypothetical protein